MAKSKASQSEPSTQVEQPIQHETMPVVMDGPNTPPTLETHSASEDPPTSIDDPLLTLGEVARRLGKHRSTVARWVDDGLLEVVRMPNGLPHVRASLVNQLLQASNIERRV